MRFRQTFFCRIVICMLVVLFSLTVPVSALKGDNTWTLKGTKLTIKMTDRLEGKHFTVKKQGSLYNIKGKKVINAPSKSFSGDSVISSYYKLNMGRLPAGKYRFTVVNTGDIKNRTNFNINYNPSKSMNYRTSKVVRNRNGDLFQRIYIKKTGAAGNTCYAEIYDKNGKLLKSIKTRLNNANIDFSFGWNGWSQNGGVKKCPKGIYTVKYWMDGLNPKTAKFKLMF